jgi:hypothetical protein
MQKLYKEIDGVLNYWEIWESEPKTIMTHFGVVGERGKSQITKAGIFSSASSLIKKKIAEKINEGYSESSDDDFYTLIIEYHIDGMGTNEDLEKRHALEDYMDELLGWTGLGHCDGGSIGNGTMEVACMVISDSIAIQIAKNDLLNSNIFKNFSKIYIQ